jgi:hypothetical protein
MATQALRVREVSCAGSVRHTNHWVPEGLN